MKMRDVKNGRIGRGMRTLLLSGAVAVTALAPVAVVTTGPAQAQNLFAPRAYVNDQAITEFEVMQRAMLMQVLRAPGNPETEAMKALIDERLQRGEAKRLGLKVTEAEVLAGMNEFAGRANMTAEQLVAELQKVGIAPETFRDFVTAGLMWRQAVRARFIGRVTITENDVDRALAASARPRALKVLLSELVLVAEPGEEQQALALAERLSHEITTEGGFAAAARRYSASPTAERGGAIEWMPLSNLPPAISGQVLALGKGDVSTPVQVPGAVVLFQMRDVARDEKAEPINVQVEWADFLVPDDPAEIARVSQAVDVCNDLYGQARGLPADRLTVHKQPLSEVPRDVGLELAKLDRGEISTALGRGGYRRLIMLCNRQAILEPEPTRDQVREQVINQRLDGMAENYLEELRAAAMIRQF